MNKQKVFFRADGHAKMGLGHVIRSLALAEMLSDVFECHFLIRNPLETLREQILEVCQTIIELPEPDNDLAEAKFISEQYFSKKDIVVLDGYHFDTSYQRTIKEKGCKLVCIDDVFNCHFLADVVINHGGGISKSNYSAESYTQFFLGFQYALLRKPFREAAKVNSLYEMRNNNVFICFGGADPNNDTLEVLKYCKSIPDIKVCYIVIGGAYKHYDELYDYAENASMDIRILRNLSADLMVTHMLNCKIAITSPSSVSLEYLSTGGKLFLKVIADNQIDLYKYYLKNGLAEDFTSFKSINEIDEREAEKILIDGNQALRFIKIFENVT